MLGLGLLLVGSSAFSSRMFAQTQDNPAEKSRSRRVGNSEMPSPSPSPTIVPKEEIPQESDEVVRVDTSLTSIFFT
ncbi:MAG TPA: hypothetical protein DHU55_19015, partial [Blastocatellia bacterium]|nr:hypothetical protein [Blastocatellia bacterium]